MTEKLGLPNDAPTLALAGRPGAGKTSLWKAITARRGFCPERPGPTVDVEVGVYRLGGRRGALVDLPGCHDLGLGGGAASEREALSRDYLLARRADLVIVAVRATDLALDLCLVLGLIEAGYEVVVALTHVDLAKGRGLEVDAPGLSRRLGVPVVVTLARTGEGVDRLVKTAVAKAAERREAKVASGHLAAEPPRPAGSTPGGAPLAGTDVLAAQQRMAEARSLAAACLSGTPARFGRATLADKVDRVVTHRVWGLPVLLGVMWAVFKFTFDGGAPLTALLGAGLAAGRDALRGLLQAAGAGTLLTSFIVDGLATGIGSVLVFLPLVLLLFVALAALEESGYMARASCVTDRFMRAVGLEGRAFVPLALGFGCNVPAILASRLLESRRERMATILVSPLMSCSARLPIFTLFAGAFFGARQGLVVLSLYGVGVALAIVVARLITRRLPGSTPDLVLELPSYRWPSLRGTAHQAWAGGWAFVRKVGTSIAAGVAVMWVLARLPPGAAYAGPDSLLGRLGSWIAPVLAPAGLGNWETASALLFGLWGKEFVVATLGVVHGTSRAALPLVLQAHFTPLTAVSFMVLSLAYSPCLATIAAMRHETGSWKWPALAVGYGLVLGLGLAILVFQTGRLLGWG